MPQRVQHLDIPYRKVHEIFGYTFQSQAFVRFWENIPVLKYKHDVVTQCEQRLTRMLVAGELRYSVLYTMHIYLVSIDFFLKRC